MVRATTPKFSQNIYKSIKLKVTKNQIDRVIQIDVVKKSLQERGVEQNYHTTNFLLGNILVLELKRDRYLWDTDARNPYSVSDIQDYFEYIIKKHAIPPSRLKFEPKLLETWNLHQVYPLYLVSKNT